MRIEADNTGRDFGKIVAVQRNAWKPLLVMLLIGIALIVAAIIWRSVMIQQTSGFDAITGTIVSISNDNEQAFVSYTYKGTDYSNILLRSYSSTWKIGQSLALFINPADPSNPIAAEEQTVFPFVLMGFGGFLILLWIGAFLTNFINARTWWPLSRPEYQSQARLVKTEGLSRKGFFRLYFDKDGTAYRSQGVVGDQTLIDTLLKTHTIECPVYLSPKGHFKPDLPALDAQLETLKKADHLGSSYGSTPISPSSGLNANDDGSGHNGPFGF